MDSVDGRLPPTQDPGATVGPEKFVQPFELADVGSLARYATVSPDTTTLDGAGASDWLAAVDPGSGDAWRGLLDGPDGAEQAPRSVGPPAQPVVEVVSRPRVKPTDVDPLTSPVLAPTDEELYHYLGPQQRWIQLAMTAAFLVAGFSLLKFVTTGSVLLYPMLIVLAINITGVVISAFGGLNKRQISRKSHDDLIYNWRPGVLPSVDVFLPSCGEDMEVLLNTYRHVRAMEWPAQLTVWVLDDSDRQVVKRAAADFGFEYRVRPNRGHMKKAGNLLYGYQQSEADHIVILDADFCPRTDFLAHLVPYMDDPEVGIVQSPQSFDTDDAKGWLERGAGATQELFYRWIQPSRDAVGAPICVGTCAIYRRSALDAVGGFAQIEHSEDVHTGILLLRSGFLTRYVPILVAKGLCPTDLAGFLNQQYRWCNGSITLLGSGQAQRHPLTLRQRLCFWGGFMYYIGTAVNVFALHIPGIVMAIAYPSQINAANYTEFLPGLWVYFVLLPMAFKGRWRYDVLRVQMAYSFCHATAIFHKLTGKTAGWVATGAVTKSSTLARTISKVGLVGIIVPLLLAWGGLCYDLPKYSLTQLWPQMAFLGIYTYLGLPLAGGFAEILWPAKESAELAAQPAIASNSLASV